MLRSAASSTSERLAPDNGLFAPDLENDAAKMAAGERALVR
jgi:hypothetical protein